MSWRRWRWRYSIGSTGKARCGLHRTGLCAITFLTPARPRLRTCRDGDEIIRQGDKGNDFFIIQEGFVLVQVNGEVVTELGSGAYFGELALLSNQRRAATVIAKGNAVLKSLDRAVIP